MIFTQKKNLNKNYNLPEINRKSNHKIKILKNASHNDDKKCDFTSNTNSNERN